MGDDHPHAGDVSITTLPGIRGHQLDPSQTPEYSPSIRREGISCKTILTAQSPGAEAHFERAPFADVDPRPFAPEYFAVWKTATVSKVSQAGRLAPDTRRLSPDSAPSGADGEGRLINRRGEVFFTCSLLGSQHLADVKVVFHTIVAHLLIQLAKSSQLLFDFSFIPFPGVNNVGQGAVLIAADFNLAHIVFESLTQRPDFGDLILTQLQMLDDRVL